MNQRNIESNILIGATGSVAAIKLAEIVRLISGDRDLNANLRIVLTERSKKFIDLAEIRGHGKQVIIYDDDDEWDTWTGIGDDVLHIELRKWAKYIVIAPLDANTLAKIAAGLCDNLLTCVIRAMDVKTSCLVVCPAMNTLMWENPMTGKHLNILRDVYNAIVVNPIPKKLACKDSGMGALAAPETILSVLKHLHAKSDLLSSSL